MKRPHTINVTMPIVIVERLTRLPFLDPDNWDDRDAKALEWAKASIQRARSEAQGNTP